MKRLIGLMLLTLSLSAASFGAEHVVTHSAKVVGKDTYKAGKVTAKETGKAGKAIVKHIF